MHDYAPAHNSKETVRQITQAGIVLLPWPSNSPDLNPIEAIWRDIKQRLYTEYKLKTRAQLVGAIRDIWAEISQKRCQELIDSMPERLQAVIEAKGGHTKY